MASSRIATGTPRLASLTLRSSMGGGAQLHLATRWVMGGPTRLPATAPAACPRAGLEGRRVTTPARPRRGACTMAVARTSTPPAGKEGGGGGEFGAGGLSPGKLLHRPLIIGVAGGTASGKTSVCERIMDRLSVHGDRVANISQDCWYRNLTEAEAADPGQVNFDHPSMFDWAGVVDAVKAAKRRDKVHVPHYDYVSNARGSEETVLDGVDVVLLEGILVFHEVELRDLFDLKIFVDTDADTRLARRVRRDIAERGRSVDSVLNQYEQTVKPAFERFILPTKAHADIIIPRGGENHVAINLLHVMIENVLNERVSE